MARQAVRLAVILVSFDPIDELEPAESPSTTMENGFGSPLNDIDLYIVKILAHQLIMPQSTMCIPMYAAV